MAYKRDLGGSNRLEESGIRRAPTWASYSLMLAVVAAPDRWSDGTIAAAVKSFEKLVELETEDICAVLDEYESRRRRQR